MHGEPDVKLSGPLDDGRDRYAAVCSLSVQASVAEGATQSVPTQDPEQVVANPPLLQVPSACSRSRRTNSSRIVVRA